MSNIKNTADLRKMLLETIDGVRKGKVDHLQAKAIGGLSTCILQSARLDLAVLKMSVEQTTEKPSPSLLIGKESNQKKLRAVS